jgi:ornithine cyclodeaminase/mu-crystallin family protein
MHRRGRRAFRLHAEGRTRGPRVLGIHVPAGGFHIKAAGFVGDRSSLASGVLRRDQVHAELGDVVAGRRPGRTRDDEITVFDSSGTALQDVAAAVAVHEKAIATGRGVAIALDHRVRPSPKERRHEMDHP